jgi:mannan endo-1,4-beta-mannosidase
MATTINRRPVGNGVNLQPSYYNQGNVNLGLQLMSQFPAIRTVRIEIEPAMAHSGRNWIQQALSMGYFVIATYHKHTANGSNDPNELIQAAHWWRANYQFLGGNFTINLMNEWGGHNMPPQNYATAYNQAIQIVRSVYTGDIIIDLPGWGQNASVAAAAVTGTKPLITDRNIVLSTHIYPPSYNGSQFFSTRDIDVLIRSRVRFIVGEFGTSGNGYCDWSGCVDYATSNGVTIIGWCWNGDGQGHNMTNPYWGINPLPPSLQINSNFFYTIYNKLSATLQTSPEEFAQAQKQTKDSKKTNTPTKTTQTKAPKKKANKKITKK